MLRIRTAANHGPPCLGERVPAYALAGRAFWAGKWVAILEPELVMALAVAAGLVTPAASGDGTHSQR